MMNRVSGKKIWILFGLVLFAFLAAYAYEGEHYDQFKPFLHDAYHLFFMASVALFGYLGYAIYEKVTRRSPMTWISISILISILCIMVFFLFSWSHLILS